MLLTLLVSDLGKITFTSVLCFSSSDDTFCRDFLQRTSNADSRQLWNQPKAW